MMEERFCNVQAKSKLKTAKQRLCYVQATCIVRKQQKNYIVRYNHM